MFPATGTSHSVKTVEHRQKIFIRKIRTVSSDEPRGARVFPKMKAFQRFRNHLYFLIRRFTYHSTHFFVLCQNLSTSVDGQSIDETNHRRFARSFASFWRKSREKEQKSFLLLFIYIYLFILPSIITVIYNNILLIIK